MIVRLDYGSSGLLVDLPEPLTAIEPTDRPAPADSRAVLSAALESPLGRRPLARTPVAGNRIGVSVCDITRAQPRQLMLEALLDAMPGVGAEDLTIFIATGTHRSNSAEEIEQMLGTELARKSRIVCHDARDPEQLKFVGTTRSGVPVWLNREWVECSFKVTTGFVEPHFFAGFSGGPKMVAPGLAGLETVMHLHDARRIAHPKATWGIIEGNPVHDDVREIARMTGVDFALDVVLNRDQRITAAFAGEIAEEHGAACTWVRNSAMRAVEAPFDVVVTTNSGYPLDQNLYQAVKGMSAAAQIVKAGGTIICAAECRDGIPHHGAYREILASRSSPSELFAMITAEGYSRPDQWQVQIQAQIQLKASVWMKSDYLTDDDIRRAHLTPIHDIGRAVDEAMRAAGPDATLAVLPQGPQTIPYVARAG